MKSLKLFPLLACLLLSLSFVSCKKDKDVKPEQNQDNIVGEWNVTTGNATAYYEGYKIYEDVIATSGEMIFDNDNTGDADFTMTVLDEENVVKAPFTWEIEGFEVIMDKGTEDEGRWAIITDQDNLQELQFTQVDDSGVEVEFLLTLVRK